MTTDTRVASIHRPVAVLKFGGTSLSNSERIVRACEIVRNRHQRGFSAVVVVSAQASITDRLLEQAHELAAEPDLRELDLLLSSGERVSAALFAICLNALGVSAIGLTGSQAGIITDTSHNRARILEVRPFRIVEALAVGKAVVVGGFQGVSNKKEITTLGRGGSDITAVALANVLQAKQCEIFSDVDGVFSGDPRLVSTPVKLDEISFTEMEEFARAGARVLHPEAVAQARIGKVPIHARSSFEPHASGTIIRDLDPRRRPRLLGVASVRDVVWVQLEGSEPSFFRQLEKFNLQLSALWYSVDSHGQACWNLLAADRDNVDRELFLKSLPNITSRSIVRSDLCLVSLIGEGCCLSPGVLDQTLTLLVKRGVQPVQVHAHPNSLRLTLTDAAHDLSVQDLHRHFIAR